MLQKIKITKHKSSSLAFATILPAVLLLSPVTPALADHFDQQINELRQQNEQANQADAILEAEAQNLQAVVDRLRGEIAAIQTEITANETKRNDTIAQIAATEVELAKQKEILGANIRVMYMDSQTTTLEMLATSENLSHFVDKQTYNNSIQDKVTDTLKKVTRLQADLKAQKEAVEKLLADQQAMRGRLAAQQAEQDRLLAFNQDQQAAFENEMQQNNAKIASLRKQQATENARLSGGRVIRSIPDTSGYPWANVPFPNSISDPWGMYQRQCVSYTAWKVWRSGRYMPYWGGRGNANQWDDNARGAGIPVDGNPKVGDVAVSNAGNYGHVMYVEQVAGDGAIYVSDYNQQFDGNYREYWISAATVDAKNLVFIHF